MLVGGRTRDGGIGPGFWLDGFSPGPRSAPHPHPHSGHWPVTPFNTLDQSSWKQRKQHVT